MSSPTCLKCNKCVERRTLESVIYCCIAKSPKVRTVAIITKHQKFTDYDYLIATFMKKHIPPKWCPKRKEITHEH